MTRERAEALIEQMGERLADVEVMLGYCSKEGTREVHSDQARECDG